MSDRVNVGPGGSLDLDDIFTYHAPDDTKIGYHQQVRNAGKSLAEVVAEIVPPGRERSLALTKIEEAVMWANAGIARNPAVGEHVEGQTR